MATAEVSHLIHDLLWAHSVPADGLEHIRVQPTPSGLEAVLFIKTPSDGAALVRARELFLRIHEPLASHGYAVEFPA
ncbi:hypothetical protein ACN9M0_17025 [Streptomyces sp. R-07]|uniref:hypothetical protein n=1 Tax=unclassified Streptomyces TaxID=2593676 RepID=UPI003428607F